MFVYLHIYVYIYMCVCVYVHTHAHTRNVRIHTQKLVQILGHPHVGNFTTML